MVDIHPTSIVDPGALIGDGTLILPFCRIGPFCKIGKHCCFGQCCHVDQAVEIGNDVKVQNGVSLFTGIHVEDFVFIGPHAVFTNDLYPRSVGDWEVKHTRLKKGCSIGANATILCGIEIGEYSMIGCGSVVIRSVPPRTLYVGNPARFVRNLDTQHVERLISETEKAYA